MYHGAQRELQCQTTWRLRRRRRRVEFFQGTLDSTNEFESVQIFDTTLRDGEQSPRTSFSPDEKREIATALDDMGVDVIEAGFPVNSETEFETVKAIAETSSQETTVCGLARVVDGDIEAALEAGVDMVHVFVSTSDIQLEDSMHASRDEAMRRAVESVEMVRDAGVEVMFSPMDATRTDEQYLIDVIEAVTDAGTDWINIPDTCGVATPKRFGDLIATVREHTDAKIDVHTHDDFGLASANALAGFEAGASQAQVSVNGIGERAGNAALEEVVMAAKSIYGAETSIDTTMITEVSRMIEHASDIPVPANKPIVGRNAFAHESGIHAAGIIENSDTFEPGVMTPEMVGAQREVVLGKHTGTHAVRQHLEDAGYAPTKEDVRAVTKRVKEHAADKREVTAGDVIRFAKAVDIDSDVEESEVTA